MSNILGNRIKYLRTSHNLTQIEFAKKLNISNSALSQYEAGNRIPSDEVKSSIADCFDVSVDWLLGRDESNTSRPINDLEVELEDLIYKIENDKDLVFNGQALTEEIKLQLKGAIKMIESIAKQK